MNYLKKLSVGLSVLLVFLSLATAFLPQRAAAAEAALGLTNDFGGNAGAERIKASTTLTFLDRAHIKVEINMNDLVFKDQSISNITVHDAFSSLDDKYYFDKDISDDKYEWVMPSNDLGSGAKTNAYIQAKDFPPVGASPADVQKWASNPQNFDLTLKITNGGLAWFFQNIDKDDEGYKWVDHNCDEKGPGFECTWRGVFVTTNLLANPQNVTNMSIEYAYSGGTIHTVDGTNKTFNICTAPGQSIAIYYQQGDGTCGGGGNLIFDKAWTASGLDSDQVNAIFDCGGADNCTGNVVVQVGKPDKSRPTLVSQAKSPSSAVVGTGPGGTDSTSIDLNCSFSFTNPLNWVMCPLVEGAAHAIGALDSMINGQLTVPIGKDSAFDENSTFGGGAMYSAWSAMRGIALSLLVIVALVMVISQALSSGPFDAYTVKKVLPRIFIAVIGVAFSWQLAKLCIGISNDLGHGVGAIMSAPFQNSGLDNPKIGDGGQLGALAIGGIVGFFTGFDIIVILSLVMTGLVSLMIGFAVIAFRNIFVIILVITAPIALVLWILPNTQKGWKLWKDNFLAVLLAFPIIIAFITAGRIFAMITYNLPAASETHFRDIIIFIAYFGPYFLLPAAFRLAGGAVAQIGGIANDRSKGFFDKQKKRRDERKAGNAERRNRPVLQARANAMRKLEEKGSSSNSRFGRSAYRLGARSVGGYNMEAAMSAKNAQVAKELNDQIATGKDDDIRGLTAMASYRRYQQLMKDHGAATGQSMAEAEGIMKVGADGKRSFKSLGGAMVGESNVLNGYKRWGNDRFAQQTALSYEMRKAMKESDVQNISDNYSSYAEAMGMSESEAMGAWIGAGFENQNQHLQFKNTSWGKGQINQAGNAGQLDATKFVDEVYEKKGSYQLSQMSSNTIDRLMHAYDAAGASGDIDTQQKISGIAENFMHEMGAGGGVAHVDGDNVQYDPGDPSGSGKRTANSQGSAHLAERVSQLVNHVRANPGVPGASKSVKEAPPSGSYVPEHNENSPGDPTRTNNNGRGQKG